MFTCLFAIVSLCLCANCYFCEHTCIIATCTANEHEQAVFPLLCLTDCCCAVHPLQRKSLCALELRHVLGVMAVLCCVLSFLILCILCCPPPVFLIFGCSSRAPALIISTAAFVFSCSTTALPFSTRGQSMDLLFGPAHTPDTISSLLNLPNRVRHCAERGMSFFSFSAACSI